MDNKDEATEYSQDPYQDGTVPADADLATSGADGAAGSAEEPDVDPNPAEPGIDPSTEDEKDRAQRHY